MKCGPGGELGVRGWIRIQNNTGFKNKMRFVKNV